MKTSKRKLFIFLSIAITVVAALILSLIIPIVGVPVVYHTGDYDSSELLSSEWKSRPVEDRHDLLGEIAGQDWYLDRDESPPNAKAVILYGMDRQELIDFLGTPDREYEYKLAYELRLLKTKNVYQYILDNSLDLGAVSSWLFISLDNSEKVVKIRIGD